MSYAAGVRCVVVVALLAGCAPPALDPVDAGPVDPPPPPPCSPFDGSETGACPDGRVCVDGACIVDLDPGSPVPDFVDARTLFDDVWAFYDARYGAFPAHPDVDWDAIYDDRLPRAEAAPTAFALDWEIAQTVAALGDAHTAASSDLVCLVDPGFGRGRTNIGACATEVADGALVVSRAIDGNPTGLREGDVVRAIDGRDVAHLLHDLERQPRCALGASTPAAQRQLLVDSLLYRAQTDRVITVERDGDLVDLPLAPYVDEEDSNECDGRVGVAGTARGFGVTTTVLTGDVYYAHLPRFTATQGPQTADGDLAALVQDVLVEAEAHRGAILDLRGNPGGSPAVYLALAAVVFQTTTPLFSCRDRIVGGARDEHGAPWDVVATPDATRTFTKPLAVLVNARSTSAADFASAFLQGTGRATLYGRPSGGAFGSASGEGRQGWYLSVNPILCSDLDGDLLEGHPPGVDVVVDLARDDVAAGVDTVIERARADLAAGTD